MQQELVQDFSLDGRCVVITGAGSGIGRETARVLAQAGARVMLADIDETGLAGTVQLIEVIGGAAQTCVTNIANRAEMDALAAAAMGWQGRIDAWVNGAGVLRSAEIIDMDEEMLDRIIGINMKGAYWGCATAGRIMKAQGGGAIVNISSAAADNPVPGLSAYAISKSGVNMLTRTAAKEFGAFNCRVNAVAPGFIETPMVAVAYLDDDGQIDPERRAVFLRERSAATPLGITGRPRDVGLAVLYLVSDASRFVTGQILRPNGGVMMP